MYEYLILDKRNVKKCYEVVVSTTALHLYSPTIYLPIHKK